MDLGTKKIKKSGERKMKIKQISVQKCGIKIFQIAVFVFAFYLIQTTADAQVAPGKFHQVISVFSDKCIGSNMGSINGLPVNQVTCFEQREAQMLLFEDKGEGYLIKDKNTGRCFDVKDDGKGDGTPVQMWDCHGRKNQLWTVNPLGEGYQIKSVSAGKCLDVRGPVKTDFTPLQLWSCGTENTKQMLFKVRNIEKIPDIYNPPASETAGNANSLRFSNGTGFTNVSQTTVIAAPKTLQGNDKYVEYTVNNIPDKSLSYDSGIVNMKLRPKAAVKNGILYIFLTTDDSSVNISKNKLQSSDTIRGYYLNALKVNISADSNFEKDGWGPKNVNAQGTVLDMNQFTVGVSKDGPNLSYSMGSTTTRTFNDFEFVDRTESNMVQGDWTMGPDIVEKQAGQFFKLKPPPAMAISNFPIYQQAIFKAKTAGYLPDKVTINVQLRPTVKKMILVKNQGSDAQAFFEAFVFYANPKTYSGELIYRLGQDTATANLIYSITLDLTPLKK